MLMECLIYEVERIMKKEDNEPVIKRRERA